MAARFRLVAECSWGIGKVRGEESHLWEAEIASLSSDAIGGDFVFNEGKMRGETWMTAEPRGDGIWANILLQLTQRSVPRNGSAEFGSLFFPYWSALCWWLLVPISLWSAGRPWEVRGAAYGLGGKQRRSWRLSLCQHVWWLSCRPYPRLGGSPAATPLNSLLMTVGGPS